MKNNNDISKSVTDLCADSCQEILRQLAKVKHALAVQFRDLVAEHEHVLQLALGEAEALAWQTPFPQLVFQDLAEEKARSVVSWISRQRLVRSPSVLRSPVQNAIHRPS